LVAVVQHGQKMEVTDLHMTFWVLVELMEWLLLLSLLLLLLLEAWDGRCLNAIWLVSHH
jgi:hypothetical protein